MATGIITTSTGTGGLTFDRSKCFKFDIDPLTLTYGFWKVPDDELPEKVIFNNPATILIWKNGDKTIVKTMKEDKYDPMVGFLMAYFKYKSGLNSNERERYFKEIMEGYNGK